jgi:hypothetical protein
VGKRRRGGTFDIHPLRIPAGKADLCADCDVPDGTSVVIVFRHRSAQQGRGDRVVVERLRSRGIGTLLAGVLTSAAEVE